MRVLKWLNKYLEVSLMILLLVAICCVMGAQVFMRYIMNNSLTWAEEFCGYAFIVFSCLSLSYTTMTNKHLRIDVILNAAPKKMKAVLEVINFVAEVAFCIMIVYGAPKYMQTAIKTNLRGSALRIPLKYIYIWLAIGAVLMLFRTIQREYRKLRAAKRGEADPTERVKEIKE